MITCAYRDDTQVLKLYKQNTCLGEVPISVNTLLKRTIISSYVEEEGNLILWDGQSEVTTALTFLDPKKTKILEG